MCGMDWEHNVSMARITVVVSVSLPPAMVAELDLVCKIEHRTRSELIREALRQYCRWRNTHGDSGRQDIG